MTVVPWGVAPGGTAGLCFAAGAAGTAGCTGTWAGWALRLAAEVASATAGITQKDTIIRWEWLRFREAGFFEGMDRQCVDFIEKEDDVGDTFDD
jgi:hypothetical protein